MTDDCARSWRCTVAVTDATGSVLALRYAGLPANRPQAYGNAVFLWQASAVPWTAAPLAVAHVGDDDEAGSLVIDHIALDASTYIAGYAVGPSVTDICATTVIPPAGSAGPHRSVAVAVRDLGPTSLAVHYETLPGYLPARAGNWVGVWAGEVSPYNLPSTPVAVRAVPEDVNVGDLGFNGIRIASRTTYTVAYFMGPAPTTAAALVIFESPGR